MTTTSPIPVTIDDPTNVAILSISEDQLQGFHPDPFGEIARRSGIKLPVVLEHIRAMLEAGTIRRVRQTMITTSLAKGSLVAWKVPEKLLAEAFDYMFEQDPFSGHVVIRTTDSVSAGSQYRLWTTLKVPPLFSIEAHARYLAKQVGADAFRLMPAKKLFALGVGHTRRREIEPGARSEQLGRVIDTDVIPLSEPEWHVMEVLKREFTPSEIIANPWVPRAKEAGVTLNDFLSTATELQNKGVIGRFATFLEHVKPVANGQRVTRYNALFHWAVPPGQELEAGRQVGRHHIMTHAYWREGGDEFRNVNVMGVAHGTDKNRVLEHKAAIDGHLKKCGIAIGYTNVFWGGRSEIKPSEISPKAYRTWCDSVGLDPETMLDPKEESADRD
tara:strand:+ start:459 stop:1619 length:1161 start_codon:yes stop_codon:yes gene_type:complete